MAALSRPHSWETFSLLIGCCGDHLQRTPRCGSRPGRICGEVRQPFSCSRERWAGWRQVVSICPVIWWFFLGIFHLCSYLCCLGRRRCLRAGSGADQAVDRVLLVGEGPLIQSTQTWWLKPSHLPTVAWASLGGSLGLPGFVLTRVSLWFYSPRWPFFQDNGGCLLVLPHFSKLVQAFLPGVPGVGQKEGDLGPEA